jgi:hypothetical protein
MQGRTTRQCRERWRYYLHPSINRTAWTEAEDRLLLQKYNELGAKWSHIVPFFHLRTDVDLKNRFKRIYRTTGRKRDNHREPVVQPPPSNRTLFPPAQEVIAKYLHCDRV